MPSEDYEAGVAVMRDAARAWLRAQANAERKLQRRDTPMGPAFLDACRRADRAVAEARGAAFVEAHNALGTMPVEPHKPAGKVHSGEADTCDT